MGQHLIDLHSSIAFSGSHVYWWDIGNNFHTILDAIVIYCFSFNAIWCKLKLLPQVLFMPTFIS
jgi:hypothetical protein